MVIPVIICGGKGVRLWPLSRHSYPKPFVHLPSQHKPLIQHTYQRLCDDAMPEFEAVITVTANDYVQYCQVAYEKIQLPHRHIIIAEPCSCNTGAAIATAANVIQSQFGKNAVMAVMPADHWMNNPSAFVHALSSAIAAANQNKIVLIGIPPTSANTGYGYIKMGPSILSNVHRVDRFIEKPNKAQAEKLLEENETLWNSGIFCMTAETALAEINLHTPEIHTAVKAALLRCDTAVKIIEPEQQQYKKIPSISFDHAVAEKTDKAAVVAGDSIGWSDIGSWQEIFKHASVKDDEGNVAIGDTHLLDCQRNLITSHNRCVVALGLQDTYIIDTPDALLVSSAQHSDQLKTLLETLEDRKEVKDPSTVFRPWGSYTVINDSPHYKVKRIDVTPGGILSYQSHQHRSENWTVIEGELVVVLNGEETTLRRGDSIGIPVQAKHRLINKTDTSAAIIEVQIGSYLEEDDIIRYEDSYGRQ